MTREEALDAIERSHGRITVSDLVFVARGVRLWDSAAGHGELEREALRYQGRKVLHDLVIEGMIAPIQSAGKHGVKVYGLTDKGKIPVSPSKPNPA